MRQFENINIKRVNRKQNKIAHELANLAIDELSAEKMKKRARVIGSRDNLFYVLNTNGKWVHRVNMNLNTCTCNIFAYYMENSIRNKCKHIEACEQVINGERGFSEFDVNIKPINFKFKCLSQEGKVK